MSAKKRRPAGGRRTGQDRANDQSVGADAVAVYRILRPIATVGLTLRTICDEAGRFQGLELAR